METPLVAATDGSTSSLAALDWAADHAARRGLQLRVVHASLWERYEKALPDFSTERPPLQALAEHIVASGAERVRLRQPAVKVTTDILPQDAESGLVQESYEAAAIVTGNRGRGGIAGLLLGSVGLSVAARAHCPVIVVRGDQAGWEDTTRPVVLAAGDIAEGSAAAEFAFAEADVRGCRLRAVKAWRCPAHETVDPLYARDPARVHEERASSALSEVLYGPQREYVDVDVQRLVIEGPPQRVLIEESAGGSLLVVGAPRRHGHAGLQLGRVTHAALHHSACPVAVIPAAS